MYSIDCHIKKENHLINKYLPSQIKFKTLSWLIYDFLENYLEVSDIYFEHKILRFSEGFRTFVSQPSGIKQGTKSKN